MSEIHENATLTPSKIELVAPWLPRQRWYAGKGGSSDLRRIHAFRVDDPAGEVGMEILFVADGPGPGATVYQVPLTYRAAPLEGADAALVGTLEHSELGTRYVYDAPHDPVFAATFWEFLQGRTVAWASTASDTVDPAFTGHPLGAPRPGVDRSTVSSAEQSNSSVILTLADGSAVMLKILRTVAPGPHPDLEVGRALARAGSSLVPATLGHVEGSWLEDDPRPGLLALAQEFLPGSRDAWTVTLDALAGGEDLLGRIRELGADTAVIHADLAATLGSAPASNADRSAFAHSVSARAVAALEAAPALAGHADRIRAIYLAAVRAPWPQLQRIHGDYHLGQVLDAPERGWAVIDFEGEPLRPLSERTAPDLAPRDVAGMLRSLDYAAATAERRDGRDRTAWARAATEAFLDGYAAQGADPREHPELLRALLLDKALYEVVYETRQRPDWAPIPIAAVDRLLGSADAVAFSSSPHADHDEQEAPPVSTPPSAHLSGAISALVQGRHQQPHDLLGQHPEPGGLRIRVMKPLAEKVRVRFADGEILDLEHEAEGVWSGVRTDLLGTMDYRLLVTWADGVEHEQDDPFRFAPTLGEVDLHLIGEGRHERLWEVLGSRTKVYDGPMGQVHGVAFAVWAPRAKAVRVIGDFNDWDGRGHPMRLLGSSGVWELFIPDVGPGTIYKYEIRGADDVVRTKADPMARRTECPPNTGSVIDDTAYEWADQDWMAARTQRPAHTAPMSVYEVHLGSWRQGLSYRELAEHLVNYVADLGFTHVEFLPVMEHPYGPSWGYQVTGYYAPTARFGLPDDFRYLVDRLHQRGIGVILDWVPGHFPRDAFALARFDGLALYEHPDPRRGDQPDWGTHIFDFGRREVRNFLVANALYWLEEFHIDGLRVDAVASMLYLDYSRRDGEWIPNIYGGREHLEAIEFLQEANATAYKTTPGIVTVAEESTSWPGVTRATEHGGLGFGFKWNMGWMNDTLRYLGEQPINRQHHHHLMTFALMYAYSENFVLPISHDEVVHGKGSLLSRIPGNRYEQLATLRAYLAFMWSHPGKQLLFMGSEFAQPSEWGDGRSLDWWLLDHAAHYRVHNLVKELNVLYKEHEALWALDSDPAGFRWLDANDAPGNTYSYLRFGQEDPRSGSAIAVVANFSGVTKDWIRIGVPQPGWWRVILDTTGYDEHHSPSQADLLFEAEPVPWNDQPYSVTVRSVAMSTMWLAPAEAPAVEDDDTADAEPAEAAAPGTGADQGDVGEAAVGEGGVAEVAADDAEPRQDERPAWT